MKIFPAIDLFDGKAVRLYKVDYNEMTVYSENPEEVALAFKNAGAEYIHLVDLEGAKDGTTPNLSTVENIVKTINSGFLAATLNLNIKNLTIKNSNQPDNNTVKSYIFIKAEAAIKPTITIIDNKQISIVFQTFFLVEIAIDFPI